MQSITSDSPREDWTLDQLGQFARQIAKRTAHDAWLLGRAFGIAKARAKAEGKKIEEWRKEWIPFLSQPTLSRYEAIAKLPEDDVKDKVLVEVYRLLGLVGERSFAENEQRGSEHGGESVDHTANSLDGTATPQWLFDVLNEQVKALTHQSFHLDAAASSWNAKCADYFDEEKDALQQDWSSWPTIFCNPPFSVRLMGEFVKKALDAAAKGSTVVLLLPSWPGYHWFQDLKKNAHVQDVIGPVAFEHHDGSRIVLNNGRRSSSIVVATLGPRIEAGTSGKPIRKQSSQQATADMVPIGESPKQAGLSDIGDAIPTPSTAGATRQVSGQKAIPAEPDSVLKRLAPVVALLHSIVRDLPSLDTTHDAAPAINDAMALLEQVRDGLGQRVAA